MADFIEVNSDLHIHGLYSGAVSADMVPQKIGEQAPLKGLKLVGTGDILNARWIKMVKEQLKPTDDESVLEHANGTKFLLQTEVEDSSRVHHIIFFPSFSKVGELRERLCNNCKDLDIEGRPKLHIGPEELAELCISAGCMIGPSHAFTPWTSLYKEFNSLSQCYGSMARAVHFLELGLSADTNIADRISELHRLTFLSNSDAHSPWPNKMGREFNTLLLQDINFDEVSKALRREGGRKCILNVGLNPLEGKYHKTRCTGCLTFFSVKDAESYRWKCPSCRSLIKKGVDERIAELADLPEGSHPTHRPPYIHIIPLSEIISLALEIKQTYSDKVQSLWRRFVRKFGNEIDILIRVPVEELAHVDTRTSELIALFREDRFRYIPGGAGVYGIPVPPGRKLEMKFWLNGRVQKVSDERNEASQRSLDEFL
ncbi:MAG: TIGR00375 family protein [Candidatus Micrarchaeia archaeon]